MSKEPGVPDETREALVEALLRAAFVDEPAQLTQRVADVMRRIEHESTGLSKPRPQSLRASRRTWSRWVSWALAATLLVALFFSRDDFSSASSALAAVEQSLLAAAETVARKYLIRVTFQEGKSTRVVENDLFVQGNDRFALRHPALLPGADLWLGKCGDRTWVVPAIGPVRTGNDLALSRWLSAQEQLSTPYLHVTTVLDRMARGYHLEELPTTSLPLNGRTEVRCRHIKGALKNKAHPKLPDTIELWSDDTTGVAMRLEAHWLLAPSQSGRQKVVLEFVEQPVVPENWFEAEGHYSGPRRILTLDSKGNE